MSKDDALRYWHSPVFDPENAGVKKMEKAAVPIEVRYPI